MTPLPTDPGWRERVEGMIERLEARPWTRYNELCLIGWHNELRTIIETERYYAELQSE